VPDLVRHRVARDVEPLPAAVRVQPALEVPAARVVALEQVLRPLGVGAVEARPGDVALAAAAELDLVARAAEGAVDVQHGFTVRGE
jgi:hypothetical protein